MKRASRSTPEQVLSPELTNIANTEAKYEQRVVAFWDVLGWRNKIASAGTDPEKLKQLAYIVRLFSYFERESKKYTTRRMSTFSDNVVVSVECDKEKIWNLLVGLGRVQFASSLLGFFIRGGITIGDILHTDQVVFGPALNRAYELESIKAVYPRIVLDDEILDKFGKLPPFVVNEKGVYFIDPYTANFVRLLSLADKSEYRAKDREGKLHILDARETLAGTLFALERELAQPLREREWEKLAWLYDRVGWRLGVMTSALSDFPRRDS